MLLSIFGIYFWVNLVCLIVVGVFYDNFLWGGTDNLSSVNSFIYILWSGAHGENYVEE